MTSNPSSSESALGFCRLLREGRLFEAEAWLKAGKPAQYDHRNVRCTPVGIAIETGFHSTLEFLLRNGFKPSPKHLLMAVRRGKVGIVELLLDHGADVRWMSFGEVVCWPNPRILKLFIERGADTRTGYPIAEVLKHSPRAFLGVYKSFIDRYPDWQFQADMALRYFCAEDNMRGVCLLLWLKANPRAKVPRHAKDEAESWESGLWQAAINGHLEIIKKIGPRKGLDDLDELLRLAAGSSNLATIEYLIGLGADPNAVEESRDTALRAALWSLAWQLDIHRHEPYSFHYSDALEALKRLLRLGARFHSENSDELRFLRRCLLKLDWFDGYELMKWVHRAAALSLDQAAKLFKDPRLRSHLERRLPGLSRMFPVLKQWVGPKRRTALAEARLAGTLALPCRGLPSQNTRIPPP
jgi:ankyrin repeat protein